MKFRSVVRVALVTTVLVGGYAYALSPSPVAGGLSIPAGSAVASLLPTVACATEDSHNCVWNADIQGNGQGNSFIDINGTAYYFGKGE